MMAGTSNATLPTLIIGGGIGGLATALALSQKGHRVQVLEQAAEFKEIGAGIQLGPNVFRMFEVLGLTLAINRVALFPDNLIMMDALTGKEITRAPLGPEFRARFGYPYALVYRADLLNVLLAACKTSHLITLRPSLKLDRFEDAGDRVSVTTEDGTKIEGCALIGADGLRSRVRAQLVHDGKPRVSGHIAYRVVLPIEEVPESSRVNSVVLWAGPQTHLVHYPLRRGALFNLVAVFHSDRYEEGWYTYGDPEELHERFRETRPELQALLAQVGKWRIWVLSDRDPIKAWSKGRVTLLGDAAHPVLPYLDQGACMAIEDAVCLANKIDAAGHDYAAAFLGYQQERYLRTGRVQLTARLYGEIYHAGGVAGELRNMMLAGRSPQQAYDAMSWLYGGI